MPSPPGQICWRGWSVIAAAAASEFPPTQDRAAMMPPGLRRGGNGMSELGVATQPPVHWPSNGLGEVPFRLYTDPEQYRLEQERIFKGPTWSFLCLAAEIPQAGDWVATTIGETAVVVARGEDRA